MLRWIAKDARRERTYGKEVEGIRTGRIPDPTVGQVAALAAVFGMEPTYLVDTREPPTLDAEFLEGLSDETANAVLRGSARLSEREKAIVLGIVRRFSEQSDASER